MSRLKYCLSVYFKFKQVDSNYGHCKGICSLCLKVEECIWWALRFIVGSGFLFHYRTFCPKVNWESLYTPSLSQWYVFIYKAMFGQILAYLSFPRKQVGQDLFQTFWNCSKIIIKLWNNIFRFHHLKLGTLDHWRCVWFKKKNIYLYTVIFTLDL